MGNNLPPSRGFFNKPFFDGYLNRHEYPPLLFRFPSLINFIYFWNNIILQRNWATRHLLISILPLLKNNSTIIDAGCGEGLFIFPYASLFPNIHFIGFDKNENHLGFCKNYSKKNNLSNASFIYQNLEDDIPITEADLLVCIGTLQYTNNDKEVISNFYKSLKKNGRAIIYTPINGKTILPFYRYFFIKKSHYEKSQGRKRIYTEKEITDKLTNAGFVIINKKYTYGKTGILGHEIYSMILMGISNSNWFSIVFILALLCFLPIILTLIFIDHLIKKNNGNGLLIFAQKNSTHENC